MNCAYLNINLVGRKENMWLFWFNKRIQRFFFFTYVKWWLKYKLKVHHSYNHWMCKLDDCFPIIQISIFFGHWNGGHLWFWMLQQVKMAAIFIFIFSSFNSFKWCQMFKMITKRSLPYSQTLYTVKTLNSNPPKRYLHPNKDLICKSQAL